MRRRSCAPSGRRRPGPRRVPSPAAGARRGGREGEDQRSAGSAADVELDGDRVRGGRGPRHRGGRRSPAGNVERWKPPAGRGASDGYGFRVFAPVAFATSAVEGLAGAVADAHVGWLLAAVLLHVAGQVARGLAWSGVLAAAWPDVSARRACAWHICGAGFTGVLSPRGGDVVRIGLAKRELEGASWPALAGTLAAESSFELASGVVIALAAIGLGVGGFEAPPATFVGIAAVGATAFVLLARCSPTLRRVVREVWIDPAYVSRCMAVLREPRLFLRRVLPWQVAGRLLRLASLGCFLHAFGLPAGFAVIVVASVTQGSGRMLPIPGAGTAAAAAALLAVLPVAAGHPVDASAVGALAITQPALLTLVGITVSVVLLTALLGVRTPRALVRAARSLAPQPAAAKP